MGSHPGGIRSGWDQDSQAGACLVFRGFYGEHFPLGNLFILPGKQYGGFYWWSKPFYSSSSRTGVHDVS